MTDVATLLFAYPYNVVTLVVNVATLNVDVATNVAILLLVSSLF